MKLKRSLRYNYLVGILKIQRRGWWQHKFLFFWLYLNILPGLFLMSVLFIDGTILFLGYYTPLLEGDFVKKYAVWGLIAGFFIVTYLNKSTKRKIEGVIKKAKIIERNSNEELYKTCDEIILKMREMVSEETFLNKKKLNKIIYRIDILSKRYQIRYLSYNSYFPSMVEYDQYAFIFVPRNFLTLYFTDINSAKALLTHEFSHYLQNDTNNYVLYTQLYKLIYYYLGFSIILLFITNYSMPTFQISHLIFDLVSNVAPFAITYLYFRYRRFRSEMLADQASVLAGYSSELILMLQQFAVKDSLHPLPSKRIAAIERDCISVKQ